MTEFYIVRHGKTDANVAGIKQGTINTAQTQLNALGRQQAQTLHEAFDISAFDRIIASPLTRTQQTAEILNQSAHLPLSLDERLLEISYGTWDGTLNATLEQQYPELFDPVIHDVKPTYAAVAKGETFQQVEARVLDFTNDITRHYPNDRIVLVTHGFTVRSFAINAAHSAGLAIPEPDNCSVTKLIVTPELTQYLLYYNRTVQGF